MKSPAQAAATHAMPLRRRAMSGVLWIGLLSALTRVVNLLQQFVLAWLLTPSDFGVLGLSLTVTGIANLLANPGIDAVLVQRRRRFHLWTTPAFWLGQAGGFLAMALTIGIAPIAAWVYEEPRLIPFLLIASFAMPLQTMQIIPRAKLQANLQFRALTMLGIASTLTTAILTAILAAMGFHYLSFAIPLPATALLTALLGWRMARPEVQWTPHFRRWRHLLGDSLPLAGSRIILTLINQGDFMVLGLAKFPEATIGIYVLSYNFAVQAFRLMAKSIESVLFPSLSYMAAGANAQVAAMMRATRQLALVTVPFCSLQILLTPPIFKLFLPASWSEAILPVQILTLGVMVNAPCWPAVSLLTVQRRFRDYFRTSLIYGFVFFAVIACAAWGFRSIVAVAVGFTIWSIWGSAYVYWTAIRPRQPLLLFYTKTLPALAIGCIAATPSGAIMLLSDHSTIACVVTAIAAASLFSVIYYILARRYLTHDLDYFLSQLTPFLSKFKLAEFRQRNKPSGDG